MELNKMTASEAARAVRSKEITARELTEACLASCSALNSRLNAFIHIFEDQSLRQADAVDKKIRDGEGPLPLAGVPVAVKDDFWYREGPTTCGAAALQNFRPPNNAAAVQQLIEAGAVIVGKANLDQFGMGSSTVSSCRGPTANPWDPGKVAGDGAAAAVATGQSLLALSSDSGGSLRIGSSHCGLFSLRPTTGLVSRYGLNTFTPSFAQVGIAAKDTGDLFTALKLISGGDPRDAATASVKEKLTMFEAATLPGGIKVGFPQAIFNLLGDEARSVLEKVRDSYAAAGAAFVDISLPHFREALQAYYVIAAAEASSNLGRFDGIRFGASEEGRDLEEWYCRTRGATLGAEAKRRSLFGAYLLSKDSFHRYYRRAQKVWAIVRRDFHAALDHCTLIMMPVAAAPPAAVYADTRNFLDIYREDLFCAPVSLSGLPALTVPAGEVGSLPVGIQLVGRPSSEGILTGFASRIAGRVKLPPAGAYQEGR